ncbi:MAG: thiol peroxidase [bacterium]|nr:thiol peroxidase [bacterium]
MKEVKFKGNALTLVGRNITEGDFAPVFNVVSSDMEETSLKKFEGRIKVVTSFPSLDTPVCDLQIREFNKRASELAQDVIVIGISKDLPFAQKRFCEAGNIKNIFLFSDYKYSSFGINYGLLIKELNLLARAALIIDKNDIVRYLQIVEEITESIDYKDVIENIKNVLENPLAGIKGDVQSRCEPCETGTPPLTKEKIEKLLDHCPGWNLIEDKKIVKEFRFKNFLDSKFFFDTISVIAEEQGHHPVITVQYNKVKVTLTTHASGGLTTNDFIMARIIDNLKY